MSVAQAFWAILMKGTLWFHLRFTLTETLLGYVIGAGLGLAGALAVSMIPAGEPVLRPFVLLAYATPKIALAPLMIIWFGIGMLPKVILAATFVFFVVFLSTLAGVATVPPQLVSVVRVMGAAPLAVFRKVVLPSALPFIVTALRLTIPAALIGAIIGEFISSNRGRGLPHQCGQLPLQDRRGVRRHRKSAGARPVHECGTVPARAQLVPVGAPRRRARVPVGGRHDGSADGYRGDPGAGALGAPGDGRPARLHPS